MIQQNVQITKITACNKQFFRVYLPSPDSWDTHKIYCHEYLLEISLNYVDPNCKGELHNRVTSLGTVKTKKVNKQKQRQHY